ncbi:MAG: redoxin domain-containing protein, partial [Bdellovibrionales bacterium]|nr:redoxin domain-containing protein [Bdellovibrionales bacterium]NQZ19973.1 redoxin domain-containing protein [Bdellovibrionales bacterium]
MKTDGELNVNILDFVKCTVVKPNGKRIYLRTLWSEQPAVLIFIRHFACIACRGYVKKIWEKKEKYEKSGGRLYFIGNGSPDYIDIFREEIGIDADAPIFTDPTLDVFKAAGFRRGFLAALGPKSIVKGVQLYGQGHR